jgi:hypothetical protein
VKAIRRMGNCVLCGVTVSAANDSREHIITNSIGGRLRTRGFVCRTCNSSAGHSWDAELARQLNSLCLFFGIDRQRGKPPPELIETTAGERLFMKPGGGFTLERPQYSVTRTDTGAAVRIVAGNMRDARNMLQRAKKQFGGIDVESLLAGASTTYGYPVGMVHLSPTIGGELSGRSIVKSAVAIAHHAGLPIEAADEALPYLRAPSISPPYGLYYERDLIVDRPAGIPLHCAAVCGDRSTGLLLGYVEYFGVFRMVVCLSKAYTDQNLDFCHGIDPRTGKALSLTVQMPFVAADIQEIYDGKRIPDGSREEAFAKVIPGAMREKARREQERVISDAVEYAFANCGAKRGEMLTPEQHRKLTRLLFERMAPYLKHRAGPRPPLPAMLSQHAPALPAKENRDRRK